jgi:tetratricopeptide (TPR) repeat protein
MRRCQTPFSIAGIILAGFFASAAVADNRTAEARDGVPGQGEAAQAKPAAAPELPLGLIKLDPAAGKSSAKTGIPGGEKPGSDHPAGQAASVKLELCGLAPSKLAPDLCLLHYRISTDSGECQAFFDQGLGYFYSYVWMESARSFETAVTCDPYNAMAWWGLFRALDRWGKNDQATKALLRASELAGRCGHREQQLIHASMQEKGQAPGVGDGEARKKAAIATLDNLIAVYDDDEEAWYFRAQLAGGAGGFGGLVSAVPFYKSLLKINPLHPGANHELLHFYENYKRPALGWIYAENYIKSSPGIPHPFHMQAHLATRVGKWAKTADRSAHAIELERAYHKEMNVKPSEDAQFSHHLQILTISLIHDGRYAEARAAKQEAIAAGLNDVDVYFRLHLAERDWLEALKIADGLRKSDKLKASYFAALVYLKQGDVERATPEVEVLQHAFREKKSERQLEARVLETQGLLMCATGDIDAGLKLLARNVEKTKNDYSHHAWGNGASDMETWGIAALRGAHEEAAEEAFLEALAHDPGCFRAALGMQILCQRQGRSEEASRFADLARRCWPKAAPESIQAETEYLSGKVILHTAQPRTEKSSVSSPR